MIDDHGLRPHPLATLRRRVESLAADHSSAFLVEVSLGDLVALFEAWRLSDEECAEANGAYLEIRRQISWLD